MLHYKKCISLVKRRLKKNMRAFLQQLANELTSPGNVMLIIFGWKYMCIFFYSYSYRAFLFKGRDDDGRRAVFFSGDSLANTQPPIPNRVGISHFYLFLVKCYSYRWTMDGKELDESLRQLSWSLHRGKQRSHPGADENSCAVSEPKSIRLYNLSWRKKKTTFLTTR